MKSGNLNFLEPSGSLQACNGTAYVYGKILTEYLMYPCVGSWLALQFTLGFLPYDIVWSGNCVPYLCSVDTNDRCGGWCWWCRLSAKMRLLLPNLVTGPVVLYVVMWRFYIICAIRSFMIFMPALRHIHCMTSLWKLLSEREWDGRGI